MNTVHAICRRPDLILLRHGTLRTRVILRSTNFFSRVLLNLSSPACPQTDIPKLHNRKHPRRALVAVPTPVTSAAGWNLQLPIHLPTPPNRNQLLNPQRPHPHRAIPERASLGMHYPRRPTRPPRTGPPSPHTRARRLRLRNPLLSLRRPAQLFFLFNRHPARTSRLHPTVNALPPPTRRVPAHWGSVRPHRAYKRSPRALRCMVRCP